jgi:hypothetical protein
VECPKAYLPLTTHSLPSIAEQATRAELGTDVASPQSKLFSLNGAAPVPSANLNPPILQADAIIQQVDTVSRELRLQVDGTAATFHIPPGCTVILNGEQVKLRLLQSGDRVMVAYHMGPGSLRTARRVEA